MFNRNALFRETQFVRLSPRVWQPCAILLGDCGHKRSDCLIETSAREFARVKGHKELTVVDGFSVIISERPLIWSKLTPGEGSA